jgi:RNA polymerase sigma-19 factor, ECF subfamily
MVTEVWTSDDFEQLFRHYHAPLCEVVDSLVRSPTVAEEVVQELFLTLWSQRDRVAIRGPIGPYLFAAARNRALKHLRHLAVVQRLALDTVGDQPPPGMGEQPVPIDELVEHAESVRTLREAIASLPERSRLALVLRWEHHMPHADVADAMGISVKGVEKLLSIAMRRLRSVLIVDEGQPRQEKEGGPTR